MNTCKIFIRGIHCNIYNSKKQAKWNSNLKKNWDYPITNSKIKVLRVDSVQFSHSVVWLFVSPWTAAHQTSWSITNSRRLLKLMSIEPVMPSNHLILCRPLFLPPSIIPSIRVFSNESVLHIQVAKLLEFQLQHQSFQWIFRTDFLYDGLVGSPCSPRDSQKSSPTPQLKNINSSGHSVFIV